MVKKKLPKNEHETTISWYPGSKLLICVQLGWLRVRWWAGPSSILLSTRWPGEPSPPPPLLLQQPSHTQASATLPLHPRYEST
jgi:hypothetical protein